MTNFRKILSSISSSERLGLFFLLFLILIGMVFEMMGIGLIIPVILSILDPNFFQKIPQLEYWISDVLQLTYQQTIYYSLLSLVSFYVIKTLYMSFLAYRQGLFIYGMRNHISKKVFYGYLNMPYSFHLQRNSSELIRNVTTEIGYLTTAMRAGVTVIADGLILLGVLGFLLYIEPLGTVIVFPVIGLAAMAFQYFTKDKLLQYGKSRQEHEGQRIKQIQQGIGGIKDVRIMSREDEFFKQFDNHNFKGITAERFQYTLAQLPRYFLEFIVVIGICVLIFLLIFFGRDAASITLMLGVFSVAIFRMLPSINRLLGAIQLLRYSLPALNVVATELDLIQAEGLKSIGSDAKKDPKDKLKFKKTITIESLNFRYQNSDTLILKNVNITIPCGSTIGIVGSSGSGKSTFVDVLLGLLTPQSGRILIDDVNIQQFLRQWHKLIGYVSQQTFLTDDTLRNNIAFGLSDEKIDQEAIDRAVSASQLSEHLKTLPYGLNTIVGERGTKLSGGQQQRVGIARALYNDPDVLVLDEATSNLDIGTESRVMDAVKGLKGSKTIIIVSHRFSTLSSCDKIYQMDDGFLTDVGTHSQLIAKNSLSK